MTLASKNHLVPKGLNIYETLGVAILYLQPHELTAFGHNYITPMYVPQYESEVSLPILAKNGGFGSSDLIKHCLQNDTE